MEEDGGGEEEEATVDGMRVEERREVGRAAVGDALARLIMSEDVGAHGAEQWPIRRIRRRLWATLGRVQGGGGGVWLVGNTLETTAVFKPDLASSKDVLIPEPPPPIIKASNSKVLIFEEL